MFLKRLFNFIPKNEFSRALGLFNGGQYRKALQRFEELGRISKAHEDVDRSTLELYTCEAHVALAKEHASEGEIAEAAEEMVKAVDLKPGFADLHYALGNYRFQLREYDEASSSFERSLAINNKFFKARIHLSLVRFMEGDRSGAADELSRTRRSCPNFNREQVDELAGALRAGAGEGPVVEMYRSVLEERPSSAEISREIAVEAIQNGDYDEASRELKKAIALKPDYPDLHNYLGIAYGNKGMVDDAIHEFQIALKIHPHYMKAHLNLALLYYENSRFEEAQVQLDEVLAVQPENQLANTLLDELRAETHRK